MAAAWNPATYKMLKVSQVTLKPRENRKVKPFILKAPGRLSFYTEKVVRCDGTQRTTEKDSDLFQVAQLSGNEDQFLSLTHHTMDSCHLFPTPWVSRAATHHWLQRNVHPQVLCA